MQPWRTPPAANSTADRIYTGAISALGIAMRQAKRFDLTPSVIVTANTVNATDTAPYRFACFRLSSSGWNGPAPPRRRNLARQTWEPERESKSRVRLSSIRQHLLQDRSSRSVRIGDVRMLSPSPVITLVGIAALVFM